MSGNSAVGFKDVSGTSLWGEKWRYRRHSRACFAKVLPGLEISWTSELIAMRVSRYQSLGHVIVPVLMAMVVRLRFGLGLEEVLFAYWFVRLFG